MPGNQREQRHHMDFLSLEEQQEAAKEGAKRPLLPLPRDLAVAVAGQRLDWQQRQSSTEGEQQKQVAAEQLVVVLHTCRWQTG